MDAQKTFENNRWLSGNQKAQFRHQACLDMVVDGSVLDVGCGDGLLLSMLAEKGILGEGIDFSEEAVQKCVSHGVRATQHDLNGKLPFPDNSFDYAVALDVLEHQFDPLFLLCEMTRVSRKNVIIGVPNFSSFPARFQTLFGRVPENNRPNKGHVYWFNYHVLQNMASQAGLRAVVCSMNTFKPLSFFGTVFQRAFPNMCALSFVICFTKSS
ncbi:MAG: methionine biosynthesis protein MetW [Candidatus Campbellbacteria bacterium]|nr:methionine biosynthesis protein MetW [Candidatus Campbellbacteria bacterium]